MPSTRMTNADRDAIRHAMIEARFGPLEAQHKQDWLALAHAIYNHVYDEKTRRWIKRAPEGALVITNHLSVRSAGQWRTVWFDEDLPIFAKHHSTFCYLDATHPLAEQLDELTRRGKDLENQRKEITTQVGVALAKFSTFERAIKDWPEAETFIASRFEVVQGRKPSVPAVLLYDLNQKLGLPPSEAQAA